MTSMRRWARPVVGFVVTGVFVLLLLNKVELNQVGAALSRISLVSLSLALIFLVADYAVRVVRWWWILRVLDPRVPLKACGWPFLVSIAVNNLVPFRAGDALRVVGFLKQLQAPAMRIFGSLVIERVLDLMTLLMFFLIGMLGVDSDKVPSRFAFLAVCAAGAIFTVVLTALVLSRQIQKVVYWMADRPVLLARGWSEPIKRQSGHFLETLDLLSTPMLALQLVGFSFVIWGFEGAVFAIIAKTLSPESATAAPWFAMASGTLATLLPSTPGYVGTFDYFVMLGLVAYGTQRVTASAFALAVHAVLWFPLTVTGLMYFLRPGSDFFRRQLTADILGKREST